MRRKAFSMQRGEKLERMPVLEKGIRGPAPKGFDDIGRHLGK